MVKQAKSLDKSQPVRTNWSNEIRGLASTLIVIHLIALGLLFWSYLGKIESQSILIARTRRVVDPYLVPLALDRGWGATLSSNDDNDSDHYLHVIVHHKSGTSTELRYPSENSTLPEERERWQRFAGFIGNHPKETQTDNVVNAFGMRLLAQLQINEPDTEKLEIECRRRLRVPFMTEEDVNPYDPYWDRKPLYVAFVNRAGFWRKSLDPRDYAPVVTNRAPSSPTQSSTASSQQGGAK